MVTYFRCQGYCTILLSWCKKADFVLQRKQKEGKQAPVNSQAEASSASQPGLAAQSGTPPAKGETGGTQAGDQKLPEEGQDTTAYGLVLRVSCSAAVCAFDAGEHHSLWY